VPGCRASISSHSAHQKIFNFSAPRQEYPDHVELTLRQETCGSPMRTMITDSPPEVQFVGHGPAGITSRVKTLGAPPRPRTPCRTEIFARVAAALREKGIQLTGGR